MYGNPHSKAALKLSPPLYWNLNFSSTIFELDNETTPLFRPIFRHTGGLITEVFFSLYLHFSQCTIIQ